ncbi:N-acetyltransferase GCN5 [Halococcus morrhuae DSM 1307]|uniref:N-acetyltransferase GCN5 n=2 Tax=Halococcus TaxID=2249 RepID=M0MRI4_HALMO|nr:MULTISPECIES: GNAT family N-acetyltransferase [Halococcus]EMA48342.1 N-acetyltransferase GCN5 [Halococcus morrhuae DSM 1307]UOO95309.1 GNAT family N-acetyltransferase [Halococcus dombrowskii]
MTRVYPDDRAGEFERPPIEFTDAHDRDIEITVYADDDRAALTEMYVSFDPADRAQGIPPTERGAIEGWLDTILDGSYNVVASHGEECVGHATLVPDDEDAHELAIFVLDTHQQAGIGSRLLTGLLGHARAEGAEHVWLTVERWNTPAVALYRKVGFETCNTESFEMEMSLRL